MDNDNTHQPSSSPVFYILCGNAAYNRGDRGNLHSQLALLKKHFPDATLVLDSSRPDVDTQWYDATVLKRGIIPGKEQIAWLKKADIVIVGGGALLADNSCLLLVPYWLLYITYIKKVLKKPVMIWANGLVLKTAFGRLLARYALNMADTITVRDSGSYALCHKLGITVPYEQTADPAILLSPAIKEEGAALLRKEKVPLDKPLICISPTFWHIYHDHASLLPYPMGKQLSLTMMRNAGKLKKYKKGLAQLVALLVDELGANILLMPRYASPKWDDIKYCHEIAHMSGKEKNVFILSNDTYPPAQFFATWKCFALNISVALHDAMFATVMDCPVLHLYYESKGQDLFKQMGSTDQLMNWELLLYASGPDRIAARAKRIMETWQQDAPKRHAAVQQMQQAAERNAIVLKALYESLPAHNS